MDKDSDLRFLFIAISGIFFQVFDLFIEVGLVVAGVVQDEAFYDEFP